MKKTLVAIAALASVSAFAQTAVIDGLIDVSYASITGNIGTEKSGSTVGLINGSATSSVNITATDDLGGGMKAAARLEIDPRLFVADGGALARHQAFLSISGGFGEIQAGTPNTNSLTAFGAGSPLGTATGSGYAGTNATTGMTTRFNRSVKYISPAMSGFTGTFYATPGSNADTGTTAYAGLPYQRSASEIGLNYNQGPVSFSASQLSGGSSNVVAAAAPTATAASTKTKFTTVGFNYNLGAATAYYGMNKGTTLGTAVSTSGPVEFAAQADGFETKGSRLGLKYVAGSITAILSSAKQDIETTATSSLFTTRKVTGMRVENALSKRTTAYVAYESYNSGATTLNKTNITAIGLRTSF